eukprot:TRINITY_DN2014_c0_g1_i6.p1 TRINITY_DN2014_c0_g1~~TRINITY_DN2014_c0_g1_i6.p1  ORF type:complete len:273 (+),score=47.89 TRINITY_DN2014_c0_g1_i6:446-1264(+)
MLKTTLLLWGIWVLCSFFYYGLVLILVETNKLQDEGLRCASGKIFDWGQDLVNVTIPVTPTGNSSDIANCTGFPESRYLDVVIATFGEIPGLVITLFMVDRLGRKKTMAIQFGVSAFFAFLMWMCLPRILETIIMTILKALVCGAFQVLYLYTPEVYPTSIRSVGLGSSVSAGRIGGMVAPYVSVIIMQIVGIGPWIAFGVYGASGLLICVFIVLLPIETAGRKLSDTIEQTLYDAISSRERYDPVLDEGTREYEAREASESVSLDSLSDGK